MPKTIKIAACVLNLDEYGDVGTHWIALYVKDVEVIYFEYNNLVYNNFEYNNFEYNNLENNSFCIGFTDFMLAGKTLIDFTNFFPPYDFENNDDIILNYFK